VQPPEGEAIEPRTGRISEVNLGLTKADLSDIPVAFDARLGWVGRSWSVEVDALRSLFKTRPDDRIEKHLRWSAGVAARWLPGHATDLFRLEFRGEGSYLALQDGWQRVLANSREYENFDAIQTAALLGGRYRGERLLIRLSAGLGWQRHTYNSFAYTEALDPVRDEAGSSTGGWQAARASLRYSLRPEWLTLRLSGEGSRYSLRRVQFTRSNPVPVESDWVVVESTDTILRARFNLDVEPLSFAGTVPSLFAGLDRLSSSTSPDPALISVFAGVGIVQQGERE
jgi:hypothetical protein